jgi:hypothetical protein
MDLTIDTIFGGLMAGPVVDASPIYISDDDDVLLFKTTSTTDDSPCDNPVLELANNCFSHDVNVKVESPDESPNSPDDNNTDVSPVPNRVKRCRKRNSYYDLPYLNPLETNCRFIIKFSDHISDDPIYELQYTGFLENHAKNIEHLLCLRIQYTHNATDVISGYKFANINITYTRGRKRAKKIHMATIYLKDLNIVIVIAGSFYVNKTSSLICGIPVENNTVKVFKNTANSNHTIVHNVMFLRQPTHD